MSKLKWISFAFITICFVSSQAIGGLTVSFDTADNWTSGSGSITSYQSDHVYSENGLTFTGGPALRQNAGTQDGFDSTLGEYSWRIRNVSDAAWGGVYNSVQVGNETIDGFSFDVRRWDSNPSPNFEVSYSTDSGSTFTTLSTIINNTWLDDSSDWKNYSVSFADVTVSDSEFEFFISAAGSTERIMVDNFQLSSFSAVPEPSSLAFAGIFAVSALSIRRRRK